MRRDNYKLIQDAYSTLELLRVLDAKSIRVKRGVARAQMRLLESMLNASSVLCSEIPYEAISVELIGLEAWYAGSLAAHIRT